MNTDLIACPVCGFQFDPAGHAACQACPLQPTHQCQRVCCPNCGFETVDVRQSKLASLAARVFAKRPLKEWPGEQK